MKKTIITALLVFIGIYDSPAQTVTGSLSTDSIGIFHIGKSEFWLGFIYAPGIIYQTNEKGDSIMQIQISGDTNKVIKDLILYLIEEKEKADFAYISLKYYFK